MVVILPNGEERHETVGQFQLRRWEELEQVIRLRGSATRPQQLLLARYCKLHGTSKSAQVILLLESGVSLDQIIPELKYNHRGKLRETLQSWLDSKGRTHNATLQAVG